jgi:hypothetical protein
MATGGVFGRRPRDEEPPAPQGLGACPCGDYALWYRETPPATPSGPGRAVGSITADQITENLCQGCFLALIPEAKRGDWKMLAPRDRSSDQTPRFDPREVSDVRPGDADRWD